MDMPRCDKCHRQHDANKPCQDHDFIIDAKLSLERAVAKKMAKQEEEDRLEAERVKAVKGGTRPHDQRRESREPTTKGHNQQRQSREPRRETRKDRSESQETSDRKESPRGRKHTRQAPGVVRRDFKSERSLRKGKSAPRRSSRPPQKTLPRKTSVPDPQKEKRKTQLKRQIKTMETDFDAMLANEGVL